VIHLEADMVGCSAEVYVNDVAVGLLANARVPTHLPDAGPKLSVSVSQYMVDGENEIAALIDPGPTPSTVLSNPRRCTAKAPASLTAVLKRYPTGAYPGDPAGQVLLRLVWSVQKDQEYTIPCLARARGDLGQMYGTWRWQAAPRLDVNGERIRQVHHLLAAIANGLKRGDPEPFIEAARDRFLEINRAYGRPQDFGVRELRDKLRERLTDPNWDLAPVEVGEFDLRACGGGRMIDCLTRDWKPILRQREGEDGLSMTFWPVRLAEIQGHLKVVR